MRFRIAFLLFHLAAAINAQNWAPLSSGITGSSPNTTWSMCSYDSALYAGGWFTTAGGEAANSLAQWNGTSWDSLGAGTDGYVSAMAIYLDTLYAGGLFSQIGGIAASDIAKWNGTGWMPVGAGLKGGDYGVYTMSVYNGILYAGGNFDSSGSKAIYAIAQWNDTTWSAVGAGGIYATDNDDAVFAIAGYNGGLYIAGDFGSTVGTNIAEWYHGAWVTLDDGTVGFIYSLAVYKGKLFAGGNISQAGTIEANAIAAWDGSNWTSPDSGIWGEKGWAIVNALTVYNGELYAGGYFDSVKMAQINCIAKWNGTTWSPLSASGINVGGAIDAMAVYNNSLYVGGGFDSAGGVYAKNIAVWTNPSSIYEVSKNNGIMVYPDPVNTILTVEMNQQDNTMAYIIYGQLGQQVECGKLSASKTTAVDVSEYPSGIYLLSVSNGNSHYTAKFIKD